MEDINIVSKYSKEETSHHLKLLFKKENVFGVDLEIQHNEYYLTPITTGTRTGFETFFIQFRLKEFMEDGYNRVKIQITPQSSALSMALGSMMLLLIWIIILAATLSEKKLLDYEIYIGGLTISLIILFICKQANTKEKKIIQALISEFKIK